MKGYKNDDYSDVADFFCKDSILLLTKISFPREIDSASLSVVRIQCISTELGFGLLSGKWMFFYFTFILELKNNVMFVYVLTGIYVANLERNCFSSD